MDTHIRLRVDEVNFCIQEPKPEVKAVFLTCLEEFSRTQSPEAGYRAIGTLFRNSLKSLKVRGVNIPIKYDRDVLTDDSLATSISELSRRYPETLKNFLGVVKTLITSQSDDLPAEFLDENGNRINVEILSVSNTPFH